MTTDPALKCVNLDFRGKVAWLSFARPDKRNAMSPALHREMALALDRIEEDENVAVVVLFGEGGNFCAGMDFEDFVIAGSRGGARAARRLQEEAEHWWNRLRWLDRIVIGSVEGWCIGGAFAPLDACDLVLCSSTARFKLPEVDFGLVPLGNITKIISERLPAQQGMYRLLTGREFDGATAVEYGLALEAVAPDRLHSSVESLAGELAAKDRRTLVHIKHAFKRVARLHPADSDDYLQMRQAALMRETGSNSLAEQVETFLAARKTGK